MFSEVQVCFAITYSLDLIILVECRNDSIVGFALLHLCLKTKNLVFNKKQFSTFVFAFELKCSRPNKILKSFRNIYDSTRNLRHPQTLANVHKSFSMKPCRNNCELDAMARRFNLIWKDRSFVFKVQ